MTVKLNVTDREGALRVLEGKGGDLLMKLLREQGYGIAGTCGGMCSCGSCHVYAGAELMAVLPEAGEDERDMLDALADAVEVCVASRLSCQIVLDAAMDGASLEIAPQL